MCAALENQLHVINIITGLVWIMQYLRLAPSRWAPPGETQCPCRRAGGRSVTDIALLCTEPRSSLMFLDTHLRTAEEREDNMTQKTSLKDSLKSHGVDKAQSIYLNMDPMFYMSYRPHLKHQPPHFFSCYLNVHEDKLVLKWKERDMYYFSCSCLKIFHELEKLPIPKKATSR